MGTGQMMLTIGAMVLLGTIISTANRAINNSGQLIDNCNFGVEEIALATKIIEQAQALAYDENTLQGQTIVNPSGFTAVNSLGPEAPGELDDFDDYNGVVTSEPNLATGNYMVKTCVNYYGFNAKEGMMDTVSTQQWSKKLDLWVWNTVDSLHTCLHMYTIKSYW